MEKLRCREVWKLVVGCMVVVDLCFFLFVKLSVFFNIWEERGILFGEGWEGGLGDICSYFDIRFRGFSEVEGFFCFGLSGGFGF